MPIQNFRLFADASVYIFLQNYRHTKMPDTSSTAKAALISTDRILTDLFHIPYKSAKSGKPH